MTNIKKIVFSLISLILIPVLFFVILEISLKIFGVGTSYNYFNEIEIDRQSYYQDNPNFADQFYPKSLNIGPIPNTFSQDNDDDTVRVYLLGGSAAMGFPHKNHGLDRVLAAQLTAALPGKKIEVLNLAMTSVNSHVVYEVARSIPDDSADFAVVLMGNNEVVGPYGPGTFNDNFLGNLTMIRTLQAVKRTRLYQALSSMFTELNTSDAVKDLEWEGMQMFTNNGVPESDPRMTSVYSHYENNLRDIIEILKDKDIQVLVSTVPVNLRHSAPFLSVNDPELSERDASRVKVLHSAGAENLKTNNLPDAVANFQAALDIDASYADTHFQLATAFEQLGQHDKAKEHYLRALDTDALRFRADTQINQIVRTVATSDDGVTFVDNELAFERTSQPYQPGWNLLVEHVHYDYSGNYVLANEFAKEILAQLPEADKKPLISSNELAKRIGFPNHETVQLMHRLLAMVKKPPFTGQSNHAELEKFVSDMVNNVTKEIGSPRDAIEKRQDVIAAGTGDWRFHFEMAALYEFRANKEAAYRHYDDLFKLYPHNGESYTKVANLLSRDGKWREVIPYLEQSLYYTRGDVNRISEVKGWLGTAYLRVKDFEKGVEILEDMISDYPDQIAQTLRAYGNLIKYARDENLNRAATRYIAGVENYAEDLIREGKDAEFPILYRRMSQIMTMAGDKVAANKWQTRGAEKRN